MKSAPKSRQKNHAHTAKAPAGMFSNAQVSIRRLFANVDIPMPSREARLKWLLDWFCERYGQGLAWKLDDLLRGIPASLPATEQDDLATETIRKYVNAAELAAPGAHAAFWEAFDMLQPDKDW